MAKPTSTSGIDATQTDRNVRGNGPTLCLALRLWGYEESGVQSWIDELHALHSAARWWISRERTAHGADLVVHLVKPSRVRGGAFCWNCAGANYALAQSPARAIEMVLFEGPADQLPSVRAGHWAAAGALSPQTALARLGHLVAAASTFRSGRRAVVRRNLLCMIARQLDAA